MSSYRVSTITAKGSLGCHIDLDKFYSNLDENSIQNVLYIEYGKRKFDNSCCKGRIKKNIQMANKSKRFDNQVTLLYEDESKEMYISTKVFRNGNLQMTGIKNDQQGHDIMNIIRGIIVDSYHKDNGVLINSATEDDLVPNNYSICLINSDFKVGFNVRRDVLYKILTTDYSNNCSYEPCIYPGVKIQYFFNTMNEEKNGICKCSTTCIIGKKSGCGDGHCKKITIAVFQSGSVIITGAQKSSQIDEVYAYISNILKTHEEKIKKVAFVDEEKPQNQFDKTKVVYLAKKNIILPECMV